MFDEASFCCDCTELTRLKNYFLMEVRSCALQVGMQLHFYVTERARVFVPFFEILAKVVSGYNLQFHRKMTQVYCDSF